MDATRLTPFNALSTPADLWIVPDIKKSKWTQEIDYYINFQITKAQNRTKKNIDANLEKILSQEAVVTSPYDTQGPLMIVPHSNLPAKCILYLKEMDSKDWMEQSLKIWNSLKRPSVKIFLPSGASANDIHSLWKDFENGLSFIEE